MSGIVVGSHQKSVNADSTKMKLAGWVIESEAIK